MLSNLTSQILARFVFKYSISCSLFNTMENFWGNTNVHFFELNGDIVYLVQNVPFQPLHFNTLNAAQSFFSPQQKFMHLATPCYRHEFCFQEWQWQGICRLCAEVWCQNAGIERHHLDPTRDSMGLIQELHTATLVSLYPRHKPGYYWQ